MKKIIFSLIILVTIYNGVTVNNFNNQVVNKTLNSELTSESITDANGGTITCTTELEDNVIHSRSIYVNVITNSACHKVYTELYTIEFDVPRIDDLAVWAGQGFDYPVWVQSVIEPSEEYYPVISLPYPPAPDIPDCSESCSPGQQCTFETGDCGKDISTWEGKVAWGPEEDFDICVNECDGGTYTQSCINSCSSKIYGMSNNLLDFYDSSNITDLNKTETYDNFTAVNTSQQDAISAVISNFGIESSAVTTTDAHGVTTTNFVLSSDHPAVSVLIDLGVYTINPNFDPCEGLGGGDAGSGESCNISITCFDLPDIEEEETLQDGSTVTITRPAECTIDAGCVALAAALSAAYDSTCAAVDAANAEIAAQHAADSAACDAADFPEPKGIEGATAYMVIEEPDPVTGRIMSSDYYLGKTTPLETAGLFEDSSERGEFQIDDIYYINASDFSVTKDRVSGQSYYGGERFYYTNIYTQSQVFYNYINVDVELDDGAPDVEIICHYEVINRFICLENCDNDPSTGGGSLVNGTGLEIMFRPIDLYDVFPDRNPRWNWSSPAAVALTNSIEAKNESVYNETPDYQVVLTSSDISSIIKYNKDSNGAYVYTETCNDYNPDNCTNNFINKDFTSIFTIKGGN